MVIRLTVILHIVIGVFFGVVLAALPWVAPRFGLGDWGDNYFLLHLTHKFGAENLQRVIASGWVRGAVTGLGLLSLATALWDAAHFRRAVSELEYASREPASRRRAPRRIEHRAEPAAPADLLDNERTPRP